MIGAAAGPILFELPFGFIIVARTFPAVPLPCSAVVADENEESDALTRLDELDGISLEDLEESGDEESGDEDPGDVRS